MPDSQIAIKFPHKTAMRIFMKIKINSNQMWDMGKTNCEWDEPMVSIHKIHLSEHQKIH